MENTPCYYCSNHKIGLGTKRYPDSDGCIEIEFFKYIYCNRLNKPVWSKEDEDPIREIPDECYLKGE